MTDAEHAGGEPPAADRLQAVILACVVGIGGYLGLVVTTQILLLFASPIVGTPSTFEATVAASIGTGVGAVAVTWIYLGNSRHDRSFLDLDVPDLRDGGYVIGGVVGLVVLLLGISVLATELGVTFSQHSIEETARDGNPELLLALIPLSIVFVGPGEELLFRNLVQKRLTETFSTRASIGIASLVFGSIHLSAYATASASAPQIVGSLGIVVTLSLVLGWLYARTEKLIVPALTHGIYNAVQFGLLYVEIAG